MDPTRFALALVGLVWCPVVGAQLPFGDGFETPTIRVGINTDFVSWGPTLTEAQIQATGAARVSVGARTIYVGTHQASAINQNPIVASFTQRDCRLGRQRLRTRNPRRTCAGRGVGRAYILYVAMTVDGGGSGIEAHTGTGWQPGYGMGGGPRVTVLLRLNANSGRPIAGTFSIARLANGNANLLVPTKLDFVNGRLVLFADSGFFPLDINRMPMTQTGSGGSPHAYRVVFDANLRAALSAEAIGWNGVTVFSPLP